MSPDKAGEQNAKFETRVKIASHRVKVQQSLLPEIKVPRIGPYNGVLLILSASIGSASIGLAFTQNPWFLMLLCLAALLLCALEREN